MTYIRIVGEEERSLELCGEFKNKVRCGDDFVFWKHSRECEEGPGSFPAFRFHPRTRPGTCMSSVLLII